MKTMFLFFCLSVLLVSCSNDTEKQRRKQYIDNLLQGKSVSFYDLQSNSNSDPKETDLRTSPYQTARDLGYSEEDLARLKNVRIMLEETIITNAIENVPLESE